MTASPRHPRPRHRPGARLAALATATALLLSACGGGSGGGDEDSSSAEGGLSGRIIWADFGGPTNEARYKTYFDAFTKDTGVEVVSEVEADAVAATMLDGGKGDYDAMHVGLDQVYAAKDNISPLAKGVARDENLPEDIRDYAFGTFFVGHAQGYLTSTFPDGGPQTWADFWDTDKFPGKRAWPGSPGSYDSACEIALLADGVAPDALYPLDFDHCSKKLDELRDDMVFYTSYPEIQQLLTSGTAAVAMGPSGQYAALKAAGQDVTVSYEQAVVSPNVMTIPAEAPNKENINALANFMNDPQLQADFAKITGYGPGNPAAFDLMDDETKAKVVNSPDHTNVVFQDSKVRAEQTDDLLAWYTEWLSE
jgi:putative spermidine/putrescine transport system substrate-binding protein